MKHGVITNDKTAMLIMMIAFVFMIVLTLACASTPTTKKVWYKPYFTREEFAKDKYNCLQESQQRKSSAQGGYYAGNIYIPGSSDSSVVTNWNLFNACMEARGWTLKTEKIE